MNNDKNETYELLTALQTTFVTGPNFDDSSLEIRAGKKQLQGEEFYFPLEFSTHCVDSSR